MSTRHQVSRAVLIRDLLIFQLKLSIDSLKDVILSPLATLFAILGILFGGRNRGRWFYRVLRWGERFDLWLNLFGAAERVHDLEDNDDGLFGASRAGSPTLLGQLELRARGGDRKRPPPSAESDLTLTLRALKLMVARAGQRREARASVATRYSKAA